uniref:Chromosome segregation protein SMC n=1 Tax=Macrostomum lignano TaxID=282301 RepID=A0A1I8JJQ4_9PLAT
PRIQQCIHHKLILKTLFIKAERGGGAGAATEQQLHDEIRRLNAALARRQNMEQMADYFESLDGDSQLLLRKHRQVMPPLLTEYDALLAEYERERSKVVELRRALEELTADGQVLADRSEVEENLHAQLAQALLEKEQSQQLYRLASAELERLADEVAALRNGTGLERAVESHAAVVGELEAEVARLRSELAASRDEAAQASRTCRQLREQLAESASAATNGAVGGGEIRRLRESLADAEQRLAAAQERAGAERRSLETRVRDAVSTAEAAVHEKSEVVTELASTRAECERLQAALNQLVDDAGARTREEVSAVRQEANSRIESLTEQLSQAETAAAEARASTERAVKEKRLAEAELDRQARDNLLRSKEDASAREDLQRRLLSAERERDACQLRLDGLAQERRREELAWRSERSQLATDLTSAKEHTASVAASLERCTAERDSAMARAEEAENKCNAAKRDCAAAERRLKAELQQAEHDWQMRFNQLEIRRTAEADTSRQTVSGIRNLLAGQQRLAQRWKDEAHGLAEKLERALDERRVESERLNRRAEELAGALRHSQRQLQETEAALRERDRAAKRLEERLQVSAAAAGQRRQRRAGGGGGDLPQSPPAAVVAE